METIGESESFSQEPTEEAAIPVDSSMINEGGTSLGPLGLIPEIFKVPVGLGCMLVIHIVNQCIERCHPQ